MRSQRERLLDILSAIEEIRVSPQDFLDNL